MQAGILLYLPQPSLQFPNKPVSLARTCFDQLLELIQSLGNIRISWQKVSLTGAFVRRAVELLQEERCSSVWRRLLSFR
jgi:hypothetical protein